MDINFANITTDEAKNIIRVLFYTDKISIKDVNDIYCEYKNSKMNVDPSILFENRKTYERKAISVLFGLTVKQVYEIFGKTITYDDMEYIGRRLHLYENKPIYDKEHPKRLCQLLSIMEIYNEIIKIDKSFKKGPFYTVKNYILNKLVENDFLVEWHYEHTDTHHTYALQFKVNNKIFKFHQPIEYKHYKDILDDKFKTEDQEFSRSSDVDVSTYLSNPNSIAPINYLWKYLINKPLKE